MVGRREGEGEEETEREERKRAFRVRSSHFSLDFSTIGPSNPDKARAKLIPTARATRGYQDCGVSTTPGGRVFSYLVSFCLKSHENGLFGVVRPKMAMHFGSKEVGPKA